MYGIKVEANGENKYYWVSEHKQVARLTASLTAFSMMKDLEKLDVWNVLEDTDNKYTVIGGITKFKWSIEVVRA
ncbi:MAG: hypothetical protein IJ880_10650 [Bacilli bacterium]|nr:hypothetical protein [Bacilli bacterium]